MANNFYWATSLTGGASGALDAIDGDDLSNKDAAMVMVQGGYVYFYVLDSDSAASESSPDVIAPDSNAGDKRWLLLNPFQCIISDPSSGEYQIKKVVRESDGDLKWWYDETAES